MFTDAGQDFSGRILFDKSSQTKNFTFNKASSVFRERLARCTDMTELMSETSKSDERVNIR